MAAITGLAGCSEPPPPAAAPAAVPAPAATPAPVSATDRPPDITFVVVDTLRADRLHLYGAVRPTSPALDALALDAVVFDRAYAPSPWTLPSVASILTGLGPAAHTVTETDHRLPQEVETLAERLGAAGYETAFFGVNPYLNPVRGLDQGFETYQGLEGLAGASLNQRITGFLRTREGGRPLFLVVHYFEPHCPYEPPPALAAALAAVPLVPTGRSVDAGTWEGLPDCYKVTDAEGQPQLDVDAWLEAYDAEVLQADGLVGELLEALRASGRYDDALIAVAGDHGESFWERGGYGHGATLDEEVVRVPLVVRTPGGGAARVAAPVSLTGLAPTALTSAGVAVPGALRGGDLLGGALPEAVLLSTDYEVASARGLVTETHTLRQRGGESALTDASGEPLEDRPVQAALALQLEAALGEEAADGAHLTQTPLGPDQDLIKQLKSIGYLH